MKKIVLLIALVSMCCYAQTATDSTANIQDKKHEIKIGAVKLLAGPIFEGTYEYIYSRDFTFGSSVLVNFVSDNGYPEDFSVTPFARFYFQESKEYGAKGFFVEGFAKYALGHTYETHYTYTGIDTYDLYDEKKTYNIGAVGLALGKKWVNNSGFVFEILAGGGRAFGNSEGSPEAVFRGDLNIGYRF